MPDFLPFIDLKRYPLDAPDNESYATMLHDIRRDLEKDGCAVLKGFVKADHISALVEESDRAAPFAHNSKNRTNPYFTPDDETLSSPSQAPVFRSFQCIHSDRKSVV